MSNRQKTSRMEPDAVERHLLFLCTGNSCRSQMAEGFARHMAPDTCRIYSAGIEAHGVNSTAVEVMEEAGIDISDQTSGTLEGVPVERITDLITLCGHADETCPAFPGDPDRIHWPLTDPAGAEGSREEVMEVFRDVRDTIRQNLEDYFKTEME